MRKAFCLIAASGALLASASTALAQGYPSQSAAQSFAVAPSDHPVHYYCGKSFWWLCETSNPAPYASCPWLRGLHSRDCNVYYQEDPVSPFSNVRSCYQHSWVRLESNYTLSYHVDSDSCYGP